jgi:hypothetical protein
MRNLIELPLVRLSAVLPLLLTASCDIRSGDPERVVVRDSAGIGIRNSAGFRRQRSFPRIGF